MPIPPKIKVNVDIYNLLKDMGFIVGFKGSKGYIKLEHPDLVIEFLVPEQGRGLDKPYPLPQLGVNAQPLRFLNFLTDNLIHLKVEGVRITLPHPANFALHKLIISQRRTQKDKASKDIETARIILQALIDKGEKGVIKKVFDNIPQKWQKKIILGLKKIEQKEVLELLD